LLQVELRDSKVQLRGPPEHVRLAKLDLEQMKLEQETRILVGKESGILVGKQGSTIQALEEKHQVTIDISETGEDVYTCTIVGPSVASAVEAVDALLQANQDFSVEILVDPIVRNTLLTDSGAPIKKLQKEVNEKVKIGMIQLTFVKDEDDKHALVVKGRRAAVELAKALVSDEIARIEASLVTINVDPLIIPKIIGKGGETIKKLKGDGAVNIDVDKTLGKVLIQSTSLEQVKRVEEEINQLLEENRLAKIELNPATAKTLYRELSRSTKREEINKLAWMGLDDDSSTIIVRGTQENVSYKYHVYNTKETCPVLKIQI
jgi:polyribonucleotide nucleotidyltransferase